MLEIFLIIVAWRRGWKGWALVPSAIGFMINLMIGASAGSMDDVLGPVALVGLGVIVALIVMIASPRTHEARPVAANSSAEPLAVMRHE
jgi:hypothetical protein